eukprot:1129018-Prymnesium_polylepis.1
MAHVEPTVPPSASSSQEARIACLHPEVAVVTIPRTACNASVVTGWSQAVAPRRSVAPPCRHERGSAGIGGRGDHSGTCICDAHL